MITLDKEWFCETQITSSSLSNSIAPRQETLDLKRALVNSGWSVFRSCDSISVSEDDLWLNVENVIWSTGNHSWIVLTNHAFLPNFSICIDCNYGLFSYIRFEVSESGYASDGSITTRPTALGSVLLWNQTYFGYTFANISHSNVIKVLYTQDQQNIRIIITNNGECGDKASSEYYAGQAFLFEKPKNPPSWWTSPWIVGRLDLIDNGLDFDKLVDSGSARFWTKIVVNEVAEVVSILLGTVGATTWPTRSGLCGFGTAHGGSLSMPPIYFLSNSSTYPGVLGIMYDAYPVSPFHLPGTRYPTTGNARGLMKAGALAIGCPYGPMVV